jgi:hypothetical protein
MEEEEPGLSLDSDPFTSTAGHPSNSHIESQSPPAPPQLRQRKPQQPASQTFHQVTHSQRHSQHHHQPPFPSQPPSTQLSQGPVPQLRAQQVPIQAEQIAVGPSLQSSRPAYPLPPNLSFNRRGHQSADHKQALLSLFSNPPPATGSSATATDKQALLSLFKQPSTYPLKDPAETEKQSLLSLLKNPSPPDPTQPSIATSHPHQSQPLFMNGPRPTGTDRSALLTSFNGTSAVSVPPAQDQNNQPMLSLLSKTESTTITRGRTEHDKQALLALFTKPPPTEVDPGTTEPPANTIVHMAHRDTNSNENKPSQAMGTVPTITGEAPSVSSGRHSHVPISSGDKGFLLGYLEGVARGH